MNIRKPVDYSAMFAALDTLMAADLPQVKLYCEIGRLVSVRAEKGAAVAAAEYLCSTHPDTSGFSPRNLRRMREFYRIYGNNPEVLTEAMTIGWTQNVVILEAELTLQERVWYIRASRQYGWSKLELAKKIQERALKTAALDSTTDLCYNTFNNLQEINGVAHMELEKIATNAVETSIAKTDRLTSFISRGDKEPCWDGNIYIHESKKHTKKNIKKVSTQIKGKSATLCEVKETIKYRILQDDLTAYMMNGGTMFFVVYIDSKTGDALQIYYTDLLPLKIKDLIKSNQKSYQVIFHKFPDENSEKTVLFLNFYDDAQRQASFAGKELPTIDDLEKSGILESLSFHCRGYGNYQTRRAIPRLMDGKSLSMYANIKGGSAPIPIEYFESIHRVMMSERQDMPVYVNEIQYYDGYQVITTAEKTELNIGSSVKISFSNNEETNAPSPMIITVKIKGTLKERIASLEFVSAMIKHKKFNIGDFEIPFKLSEADIKKLGVANYSKRLAEYNQVQALLNSLNVKKDLDIQKCNDEDFRRLNFLIGAIRDKLPVKNAPDKPGNVQKIRSCIHKRLSKMWR